MKNYTFLLFVFIFLATACSRDDYFQDTGVHDPRFDGNIMEYLESKAKKPIDPFDTLVQIIRLADMEEVLKNETVTFFAVPDPSIGKCIDALNLQLYFQGIDPITSFDQVKPIVWRYFLSQYIIRGDYGLIDFPQVDTTALNTFAGKYAPTYNPEEPVNVGVVYHDLINEESVLKYKGPRQLMVSYIPDRSRPKTGWINALISSSNIQPKNGRVHVINYNRHTFGFDVYRFVSMAFEHGITIK